MVGDEVMSEIKLCKDCKHSRLTWVGPRCYAPANMKPPSLIDGKVEPGLCGFSFCEYARPEICGVDGLYWEPKPKPWWRFWK